MCTANAVGGLWVAEGGMKASGKYTRGSSIMDGGGWRDVFGLCV